MGKINIKLNGMDTSVDAIRYFRENGIHYFIYTLGELDNQNYQISYVTKIEDGKGQLLSYEEWANVKEIIKRIVRESKLAQDTVEDKKFSELEGLEVLDTKPFKLPISSTNLLRIQNTPKETIEVELENDVDPVLPKEYTFDIAHETDQSLELPSLEPSKTISFQEFEVPEDNESNFEDKFDINQFEEMLLSELPETEPLSDVNELNIVDISKKDQTIVNLENMKTSVTKGTISAPVVSKELANPTFVPIDPFKNIQSEKNALNHELEPLNIDEYQAPKKETQTTSIDYDKLELEICELRKQIAELTKKIG